ncbi:Flp family type IVb pilin [Dethiobacter alkaliphilus]|uniref:Flp/Fap pilin component n=1 Tax=Dethiobacter alkaliphilus AHT 1 TaxID=555088 RepID=C0GEA8_DETAL|nr:Flp family type IVb pilin [Dethiobacter alkaliphilus]EEG78402.1 Flp/Fap pilin component [Dethiobacter alkaliphilus AHT 1]
MKNLMMRLVREEKGQGLAEYGLILVFVALAVIVGLTAVGTNLNTLFSNIAGRLVAPQ